MIISSKALHLTERKKGGWSHMDQYLSTVIIAVITGVFSVITLILQKKQDKVINKIDEQTMFIEKEKSLKQKITQKEKECENIIHEIMLLILETNMAILKNTQDPSIIDQEVFDNSEKLKNRFAEITKDIQELTKEYSIIMDVSNEFNREMHEKNSKN